MDKGLMARDEWDNLGLVFEKPEDGKNAQGDSKNPTT